MNLLRCVAPLALVVAPCVLLSTVYAQETSTPPTNRIVNRVAATVNGRPITSSEVRARLQPYIRELMMLYPRQGPRFSAELIKAKKEVMQELINRELVLSEFESKGYQMPESAIDDEISRRILVQFNGDRDALLDNLRKSGMTYSEFRESVRKEITVAAMRSSRYDRGIPPTPDEIREEYNATKHEYRDITKDSIRYDKIFIPALADDPNVSPEQQFDLANELKARLERKEITFAEAAREYSRDMHAQDGGQWPSIRRCDLAVEFANIVFSLEPGKIIGPLLDPAGFTIVCVRSKKLAPAPPLSKPEVKEKVDDAVRRKQSEARYRQWVERLRDKAIIRTYI
ncbi:MAG: SurA N-terminal domain-containing protein [Akkermansia sp.]|nr:SurA N-terminal domain-containing protein [Akkermansia sp.]